jgi:hypothetical protein
VSHCCPENDTAVLANAAETEQMSSRDVSGRLMLRSRKIEFSSLGLKIILAFDSPVIKSDCPATQSILGGCDAERKAEAYVITKLRTTQLNTKQTQLNFY